MKTIVLSEIDEKYKYILDRYGFERHRSVSNAAFMLSKHMMDSDSSFLKSEIYKKLIKRAEEATFESAYIEAGVVSEILSQHMDGEFIIPKLYRLQYNRDLHDYYLMCEE